jgi:hypothetical protein
LESKRNVILLALVLLAILQDRCTYLIATDTVTEQGCLLGFTACGCWASRTCDYHIQLHRAIRHYCMESDVTTTCM